MTLSEIDRKRRTARISAGRVRGKPPGHEQVDRRLATL